MVPFAPRVDRPVYCSSCFDKVRAGTLGNDASAGGKAVPETVPTAESELPPILPPSPPPSGGSG